MSDELNALQETAKQARAKTDELNKALTEASTDEELAAVDEAENAAVAAETALADAKAKADADAAAHGGNGDNRNDKPASTDASESRTGYADRGMRPGDRCLCPDGRKGTVHSFDAGMICIPNHDQSE